MRIALVAAALLLAASPLAAQSSPPVKRDTAPPSPNALCADRNEDGKCDDATRTDDCARDTERPCTDAQPMGGTCVDRDRDRKCDARQPKKGRGLRFLTGIIGGKVVDNVSEEKGGTKGRAAEGGKPRMP